VQPGHDARVEDVEVEMDEDLAPREQLGQPRRALDEPDAVRLDQDALAGVDVADAAHDHLRGIHVTVVEAGVPRPARRRQAHPAQEARGRRRGVVEVRVGVEPQHERVGAAAGRRPAAW
jgi:hypothetical protein